MTPSGRQVELRYGRQRAVLVEVGGGIRSYAVGSWAVLDGYEADEMCPGARGQPLAPWPNRLRGGEYQWGGQRHLVPLDEPERGNALHGLTRWRNWVVRAHGGAAATLGLRLHPMPGYPFEVDVAVAYALGERGLTVTTTAQNLGHEACPFAYGAHPYLSVGTAKVDAAVLRLPAGTYLPTDRALIPRGRAGVAGTVYDFRAGRGIGATRVDHAFTDLARRADGRAEVSLARRDGTRTVSLWADEAFRYVQVYTGDAEEPARRRRGLAVEPMTAPPNALATGDDVLRLEPGQAVTLRWGVEAQ